MNRQTFTEYLEQPSKLYQLSLTELQGLVLEYPYSANLRLLLLLKAKLEGHPKAKEMLAQASARTCDRSHLYDLLQQLEKEGVDGIGLREERLELQELDKLEFEFIPQSQQLPKAAFEMEATYPSSKTEEVAPEPEEPFALDIAATAAPVNVAEEALSTAAGQPSKVVASAIAISSIVKDWHITYAVPKPLPISNFIKPAIQQGVKQNLARKLRRHRERQLEKLDSPAEQSRAQFQQIARKSIRKHEEVASETLADLLVRQAQYDKAIKMYQRLSLLYPEKKVIFAGLIKSLQEKL